MSTIVLPTCPHEDCTFIGHHWHDMDGSIESHLESPCTDPWSPTNRSGCVDTHESAVTDASKQLPSEAEAWRPVTFAEIQPGWEVRSRSRKGSEVTWGVAHHQDRDGDWRTEAGALLTYGASGWTYETTAPESEPDPRVGLLEGVCLREGVVLTRSDAALLLSIADAAAPTNP